MSLRLFSKLIKRSQYTKAMYANSTLKHVSHAEPSHLSHQKIPNKTNACHVKGEAFARCSGSGVTNLYKSH